EGNATLEARILRSRKYFLQHALARFVRRMSLAGENDLDGTAGIGQQPSEPLGIVEEKIRALVGRKSARKPQREDVGGQKRSGSCEFGRVFPLIAPTVTGLLTDIVKQQMAEAFMDSPQPVIVEVSNRCSHRFRFGVRLPIRA